MSSFKTTLTTNQIGGFGKDEYHLFLANERGIPTAKTEQIPEEKTEKMTYKELQEAGGSSRHIKQKYEGEENVTIGNISDDSMVDTPLEKEVTITYTVVRTVVTLIPDENRIEAVRKGVAAKEQQNYNAAYLRMQALTLPEAGSVS